MNNINRILLATTILLTLIVCVFLGWQVWSRSDSYYAVLTSGGDLFFGKIRYFPSLRLTDVWTLQRNSQDESSPVSLVRFDQSVWGPEDVLYLNKKNIVWKTKLREDGQVLSKIKNPQLSQPQPQPQPQSQQLQPQPQKTSF